MAKHDAKEYQRRDLILHWARFLMAVLAILIAATHLASVIPSGAAPSLPAQSHTSNQTVSGATPSNSLTQARGASPAGGINLIGTWLDIEVVAYTLIAVVFLLGLRKWYIPAVLFNAFNIVLYFGSGIFAIPGITSMAFGNRLNAFIGGSFTVELLIISWILALILGLIMLKYDPGSELDRLLVTRKN